MPLNKDRFVPRFKFNFPSVRRYTILQGADFTVASFSETGVKTALSDETLLTARLYAVTRHWYVATRLFFAESWRFPRIRTNETEVAGGEGSRVEKFATHLVSQGNVCLTHLFNPFLSNVVPSLFGYSQLYVYGFIEMPVLIRFILTI